MTKGINLYGSVLMETPEIALDAYRVAAVLPEYEDSVGDGIRVIYIDGEEEVRRYTNFMWRERITRFHGVSISEQRAVFADRIGKLKNNPFYLPQGFVVFGQFPVRDSKRVKTDSSLGFIAVDQIQPILPTKYVRDADFLEMYPNAECVIQLRCGRWIPCYMKHQRANGVKDHAVCIQTQLFEQHELILQARKNGGKVRGTDQAERATSQALTRQDSNTSEPKKKDEGRGKEDSKHQTKLPDPK